ncbi:hypothetical protein B0O99DRAFT_549081 [Bisporella sp. PMI_857]|nr:hypothetical protein B0O99DRAFT_549081 [Bisporella sp. PMI_857]
MAPQKRRRQVDNGEVIAVEVASSNLRNESHRKKARVSVNQRSAKSNNTRERSPSTSESEDEALPDVDDTDTLAPAATQYEELRDDDWKELEAQEMDDKLATQRFKEARTARVRRVGDNAAVENAIIEEINCVNFMCHENMTVELGPLINFVVGQNGSGKSAVLTAITLCLGGKASATNRGASLKSLIKEGQESALLRVRLKNGGADAYQPDLYGDAIIVERHFSKSGSSGFKLKSSTGRTISTKKGDVDDLIEYYQLQVDNPMNVLTQDAAKSFIQNSTPKQKYQFFYEGVQLQQLDNDYILVLDTCDNIAQKLEDSKEDITILRKKAEDAKAKAEVVDKHQGMRREAKVMGKKMAWSQVEDQERALAKLENELRQAEENINQARQNEQVKGEEYRMTNEAVERAQSNVIQLEDDYAPLQAEHDAAKEACSEALRVLRDAHDQQKSIGRELDEYKRNVIQCQKDIESEIQRIEAVNGGAQGRMATEIQAAENSHVEANQALTAHDTTRSGLDEENHRLSEAAQKMEAQLKAKMAELAESRKRLQALDNSRGDAMAGYERGMPDLLKRIDRDTGFKETPIGPIGLYVKLLKPEWSPVVEAVLGGMLNGFVVTSKADQARLAPMMRQFGCNGNIFIANRSPNFAINEPDAGLETILRVVEIDDDLVRAQMIINSAIEQTILISSRQEGERRMFDGPRLRNVKACYTHHDSRKDAAHRLVFTGRGGRETGGLKLDPARPPRMKTDISSRIRLQTEMVNQVQKEKVDIDSQLRVIRQSQKKCETAFNQFEHKRRQLKIEVQRAQSRIDELNAEYDKVNIEDGKLEALKRALEDAERDVTRLEDDYGSQGLERERLNRISEDQKKALVVVKLCVEEHDAKMNKAKTRLRNTNTARNLAVAEKNHAIVQIEEFVTLKDRIVRKRDEQMKTVEVFTAQAADICERVPLEDGETHAIVEAKYAKLRKQLDLIKEKQGASDGEIYAARERAFNEYENVKKQFDEMTELLQLLKQSFARRMEMFRRFRRHISARSRINFNYLLTERDFRGSVSIDHKAKLLDVKVEPDGTKKSGKGRQTKTLSGGEKSFSSICLLLALWEAMGAPLRCLDEYDVFMDDVNRDVSSRMIISAARRAVGRQFILITPKALGTGVEVGEDVKIVKMEDPRNPQRSMEEFLD